MANRYWVGGSGTWDTTTTHWSTSSGGPSGASVPTAADSVFFDQAGTYTVTISISRPCLDLTVSAGTVTFTSTGALNISGSMSLISGTVWSATGTITFNATSAKTITSGGTTISAAITFNGTGGSWQLQDALTLAAARILTHSNGTLDLNGKTLTVGTQYATGSGTKNLTFNGGTLVCPNTFNNGFPSGFTTSAGVGSGTINMLSASTKVFTGGGSTYNCTLNQGGAGQLNISGSNTFSNITNTVRPATIQFPTIGTNTFINFNLSGTAGNLVTIQSSAAGTQATISKSSGTVSCDYLSIKDSNATGGASWYAGANSTNVSNNTGWIFTAPPGNAYTITALNGTYAVTGQTITILRDKLITANAGSYSITGQSAVIQRTKLIAASYGTYAVTGQSITIQRSKLITASAGSYAVTGQTSVLTRSKLITASAGSYAVTGQNANLIHGRVLYPSYGNYAVTGQNATLVKGRVLNANAGSYAVTGQDITLSFGRLLSAQNGVYSVTGEAVDITVSGGPPPPITAIDYFIWIRSFTERRRI